MPATKGDATQKLVFDTALKLFRRRGFERATMRDIAAAAGLSLGAAYHYFPSKDAIVQRYYEWIQEEHERLASFDASSPEELGPRVRTLISTKLELLRRDRKLLGALFAHLGDPSHALSVFGRRSRLLRERSVAQFIGAFAVPGVPEELRDPLGRALWLAHLAVFLFFIHDRSPNQRRTGRLADMLVELVASGAPLLAHPLGAPIRNRIVALMTELGETSMEQEA